MKAATLLREAVAEAPADSHASILQQLATVEEQMGEREAASTGEKQAAPEPPSTAVNVQRWARGDRESQVPMVNDFVRNLRQAHGIGDAGGEPPQKWEDLIQAAQRALADHSYDRAIAHIDKALTMAAERAAKEPRDVTQLLIMACVLPSKHNEDRVRIVHSLLVILDGITPADHPRLPLAFREITISLAGTGMEAESRRLIDRQERIILAASGEGSLKLNSVDGQRRGLSLITGDSHGALIHAKRILERTEAAAGPRSYATINALRDVANSYRSIRNWPEEERARLELIRRSVWMRANLAPRVMDLGALARRYQAQGDLTQAAAYFDQAIELARDTPGARHLIPGLLTDREASGRAAEHRLP